MKKIKTALPFLTATFAAFYLLPLFIEDTGSAMAVLLAAIPAAVFICALLYGKKAGFDIIYSALVAALFIPSVFIYYNATAWPYAIMYAGVSLLANFLGALAFKK